MEEGDGEAELEDRLEINCTKERTTCGHLILRESVVYLTRYITKPSRREAEPSRRTRFPQQPKETCNDRLTMFARSYEERILQ